MVTYFLVFYVEVTSLSRILENLMISERYTFIGKGKEMEIFQIEKEECQYYVLCSNVILHKISSILQDQVWYIYHFFVVISITLSRRMTQTLLRIGLS